MQVAVDFINRYRPFILYSQQHGCWVPGNTKSQRISHVIGLVLSVFHVETRLNCVCSNHKSKRIVTHRFQFEFIRISKSWLGQTKVNCIFDASAKKLFAICITIALSAKCLFNWKICRIYFQPSFTIKVTSAHIHACVICRCLYTISPIYHEKRWSIIPVIDQLIRTTT